MQLYINMGIAKEILYSGWETITKNFIYTINSDIGTCGCPIGITGTPCKHQGAVKNSLIPNNCNFLIYWNDNYNLFRKYNIYMYTIY